MLRKRPSTSSTLLACTVVNTRWPVRAELMAIWAVSWSRISPTMILSGSWRRMERRPRAKVSPFFSLTGIWVMPLIWYSTGSSMVMILSSSFLISLRAAYSVVVLPRTGGAGDQHHAVRLGDVAAELDDIRLGEAHHVERQLGELLAHGLLVHYSFILIY